MGQALGRTASRATERLSEKTSKPPTAGPHQGNHHLPAGDRRDPLSLPRPSATIQPKPPNTMHDTLPRKATPTPPKAPSPPTKSQQKSDDRKCMKIGRQ